MTLALLIVMSLWSGAGQPDAKHAILSALSHFGRGVAHAALGRVADAERERAAYLEVRRAVPAGTPWNLNTAAAMFAVTDAVLDARMAWAKADKATAVETWKRAVAAEDTLNYDEPPDWYYPGRESLGAALYLSGRYEEAERVFREDLERTPRNGRSLFGLWQTLLAQKKADAAAMVERQFTAAWSRADVRLRIEEF